jgi:hypothetical protein
MWGGGGMRGVENTVGLNFWFYQTDQNAKDNYSTLRLSLIKVNIV